MRQARRRQLTGARRRGPVRNHSSSARWMHLSHKQVGQRSRIQIAWIDHACRALIARDVLQQAVILKLLLLAGAINIPNINADIIINTIIQLAAGKHANYCDSVAAWFQLDHICHDISPLEEARTLLFYPHRNWRVGDWDDFTSRKLTGFHSPTLRQLYRLFGLENHAGADGCIPIPTGCTDGRGQPCYYRIHAEELFLFFMTRCRKGLSIMDMVDQIFGGYYNRWSFGWPWIVKYLDCRYRNIIGHQGLLRYRDDFPEFFAKIEEYVTKPKWHRNEDGQEWWSPGLLASPFRIFGFVDCSIFRTNVPFSGPDGNYIGAPRKRRWGITQRAFYTGHKCRHGVKIETVFLPNGVSTIFGPTSCRRPDVSGGASVQVRLDENVMTLIGFID